MEDHAFWQSCLHGASHVGLPASVGVTTRSCYILIGATKRVARRTFDGKDQRASRLTAAGCAHAQ
eukprot:9019388-Prorocentrum_lima.AAC.1